MRTALRGFRRPRRLHCAANCTFIAVLQLFCPAALLPGLLRCLCRLLLPCWACTAFVICCLACSAAFVYLYCLSGHGRLCLLRCLCRLLLPLSTVADFVDFYCLCRLLLPLSTFTAFVGFHCLCLISLSLSAMLTLTTGCRNLLIVSSILLCKLTFGFLQTLSLYRDRSTLVYIYIYI